MKLYEKYMEINEDDLQKQINALEMIELMFEYKEISKETIAKKKKELAAAMKKQREKVKASDAFSRQQDKDRRAHVRKQRGLTGRRSVATSLKGSKDW
jgi:hypothetical protein